VASGRRVVIFRRRFSYLRQAAGANCKVTWNGWLKISRAGEYMKSFLVKARRKKQEAAKIF